MADRFRIKEPIALGRHLGDGVYDAAVVFVGLEEMHPFVHASRYDSNTGTWSNGTYFTNPAEAYFMLRGWEWTDREGGAPDA